MAPPPFAAEEDPQKENMLTLTLYTIGSSGKTAERFFETLKRAGVKRLLDVRLAGESQLAGFAKRVPGGLDYLAGTICGAVYQHLPDLAPTREMMKALQNDEAFWPVYERRFNALLLERGAIEKLERAMFDEPCCLLCSEASAERCHRRLVAEAIQRRWPEIDIVHLGAAGPDSMRTGVPVPRIREASRHVPGRSTR